MIADELFRKTLAAAYDLHRHRDAPSFEARVAQIAGEMLGADTALLVSVDVERQAFRLAAWPPDRFQHLDQAEVFRLHSAEHPFVARCGKSRSTRAVRLGDLVPREQFARTDLYRSLYRFQGIEHQLLMLVASPDGLWRALAVNRRSHDFTADEVLALESLWAHVMLAQRKLRRHPRAGPPRSVEAEGAHDAAGIIVLNSAGTVMLCSQQARFWLEDYFGRSGVVFGHRIDLPRPVRDCFDDRLRRESTGMGLRVVRRDPLVAMRGERYLSLDLNIDRGKDLHIITLEEVILNAPAAALETLGLTAREAEVMSWVAQGKTAREIGMILGTSTRTVQKHMEHIFEKLGVESRTAAILKAWQSARFGAIAGAAITRPSS
jgi:DNA-binding CsgD family transcriptional regulator